MPTLYPFLPLPSRLRMRASSLYPLGPSYAQLLAVMVRDPATKSAA